MARARTPEGPPPPPAVQKLRIRYARRGRLRFSSTRDFARALERALRRAEVPMAFSAGFHPHPMISYAGGAPTGAASEAEYLEISVVRELDPLAVQRALDAALPTGLDVLEVVVAGPGSLADRLQASHWQIELPGADPAVVREALARFLATERAEVTRTITSGPRTFDVRGPVLAAEVTQCARCAQDGHQPCAILDVVVRHTTPVVRPDDVLTALQSVTGFAPPRPIQATRLAQGPLANDCTRVADPLAADRDTAGR